MNYSISDLLKRNRQIYGVPNDRLYNNQDLLHYQQKFILYYLRDINADRKQEAIKNLIITFCWFSAIVSRFHIDLEKKTARRYPYKCPFCLSLPCVCNDKKNSKTKKTGRPVSMTPKTVEDWQEVIEKIYPDESIEEINSLILLRGDQLSCSFRKFLRDKGKSDFKKLENSASDFFVMLLRALNSLSVNLEEKYKEMFKGGCYVCHKTPCECNFLQ